MTIRLVSTILALLAAAQLAYAADSSPTPRAPSDPYLERFDAAKARLDWGAAAGVMKEAVAARPDNADYHNLYAYALRKGGTKDMDLVFRHYNEALRIDPKHRGALEYSGELYLQLGQIDKAEQRLATLNKVCFLPCSEYTELKKAVERYKSGGWQP